jgi:hypothetical protein
VNENNSINMLDDLITTRLTKLSSGSVEQIAAAKIIAKTTGDLCTAFQAQVQKIIEAASMQGDPQAVLGATSSSLKTLNTSVQAEVERVRRNHDLLVIRLQTINEMNDIVKESVKSLTPPTTTSQSVRPTSLTPPAPTPVETEPIKELTPAPVPEIPSPSSPPPAPEMTEDNTTDIYNNENLDDDPELPAHVSKFFKDEADAEDDDWDDDDIHED